MKTIEKNFKIYKSRKAEIKFARVRTRKGKERKRKKKEQKFI